MDRYRLPCAGQLALVVRGSQHPPQIPAPQNAQLQVRMHYGTTTSQHGDATILHEERMLQHWAMTATSSHNFKTTHEKR